MTAKLASAGDPSDVFAFVASPVSGDQKGQLPRTGVVECRMAASAYGGDHALIA